MRPSENEPLTGITAVNPSVGGPADEVAQFPGVPFWVWIIGFIALTTALNIRGIKTAERANDLLMAFQVLVIGIFVVLSLRHVLDVGGAGALTSTAPFANHATTLAGISAGAAIAA
ncbi:hypothetical protein [Streptomyces lydicus]|uniref:hypothetical protein n=1 Tax=Streptomyces lydicus TaxID=47763 RepID=UPI0036E9069E